jgi:hypothetical protein
LKFGANPNASIPEQDIIGIFSRRKKEQVTGLRYAIGSRYKQDCLWKARILLQYGANPHEPLIFELALTWGDIDLFRCLVKEMKEFQHLYSPNILSLLFSRFRDPTRQEILEYLSLA